MKVIKLTKGKSAIVDDADADRVSTLTWCASKGTHGNWHALTRVRGTGQPGKKMYMHRFVLNAKDGAQVDHVNGDGLDNRRSNLRFASNSQNQANRRKVAGTFSRFKGVSRWNGMRRWQAAVKKDGKRIALGLFDCEEVAARAYDKAARKLHGQYARLNFP